MTLTSKSEPALAVEGKRGLRQTVIRGFKSGIFFRISDSDFQQLTNVVENVPEVKFICLGPMLKNFISAKKFLNFYLCKKEIFHPKKYLIVIDKIFGFKGSTNQ
jgi:hypothetical protein